MKSTLNVDLCIIGAGAGGLSVAAGASQMGATVALVESGKMGGDCLNYGCIPSKSLLAAAKAAHHVQLANHFGVHATKPMIDFTKVMAHVHNVIQTIHDKKDSVERFTQLGVKVIQATGKFLDAKTVVAGDTIIKARRFVIATGSSPVIFPLPGLETVSYYTNETVFGLTELPAHLIIIGGGPIGCELGQAFRMLGSHVSILEANVILPRDDQELVGILKASLLAEGINIYEKIKIQKINNINHQVEVVFEQDGRQQIILGSHLLLSTGRRANVSSLDLEAASIGYSTKGIEVDARLRTTNKRVYAIGDVASPYQFTHAANYQAGIVIQNILFRLPAKVNYQALPWVTYTEPELAHVGLSVDDAKKIDSQSKVLTWNYDEVDRAIAENKTLGKIKVVTTKKGKILGVSIVGVAAGEILIPWISAIQENKSIRCMTNFIMPYPTFSEINKFVASEFYKPILFSKWIKAIVRFLRVFG